MSLQPLRLPQLCQYRKLFDSNRRYKISSVLTKGNKVLDVKGVSLSAANNGARIQLYEWEKDRNPICLLEEQTDGTYVIRYDSSSLVLDVELRKRRCQRKLRSDSTVATIYGKAESIVEDRTRQNPPILNLTTRSQVSEAPRCLTQKTKVLAGHRIAAV